MPKYIIFTTVKNDGVGDFNHFEDIVKAINANINFAGVELFLIVDIQPPYHPSCSSDKLYKNLLNRTKALGHKYCLSFTKDHISMLSQTDSDLLKAEFADAEQAIIVSYDMIFNYYEKYLPRNIVVKFIPEHDGALNQHNRFTHINPDTGSSRSIMVRGMGLSLSRQAYGIKVQNLALPTQAEAIQTLQEGDAKFVEHLLTAANVESLEELLRENVIIPAYFTQYFMLTGFLEALISNPAFLADKNIIIYHSGFDIANIDMRYEYSFNSMLGDLYARSIQAYFPEGDKYFPCENSGRITIRIFNGFYLSDRGYQAIFNLAPLVGVSGDNSFELAIATKKLPFYWSTNAGYKHESYAGLIAIAKNPRINISAEARQSYIKFFELSKDTIEEINLYKDLNLQVMIDEWPVFADYIKNHHNFYDKLTNILCENLPRQSLPQALRNIPKSRNFLYLFGIYSEKNHGVEINSQPVKTNEDDCVRCVIS